jgi:hypothetical protein
MFRMIDGEIYAVKKSETRLELTVRQLGVHREAVIRAPMEMEELDRADPAWWYWHDKLTRPVSKAQQRERDEASAERVARRRKTEARRRAKAQGATTLLTGTYKANQGDPGKAWRHWKEFVRRVRRVWPTFSYVVAWERQKRGALHWHAAVHNVPRLLAAQGGAKVKSYNVLRAIWRAVAGDDGGNVDVSRYCRFKQRSPARIASYIAKYVMKAHEWAAPRVNVWSSSYVAQELPLKGVFARDELLDVMRIACELLGDPGRELCAAWIAPWRDTVYLASEPARERSCIG